MAPLCKRALRYLGIIKKYVVPRKSIAVFSCILIASLTVVGFVLLPEPVSAVWYDDVGRVIVELIVSFILMIAKLFMQITVFFLSLFIAIAKYNDYINADIVILGWGMVRDVANMFFIVVLMVIAFATILGLESYAWKKTLGKFILMAILVNFSNLIFQVIIDIAQVFTLTFANAIAATAGGNLISIFNMDKFLSMSGSATPKDFTHAISGALPAAVMAGIMALIAMVTMASYCILMVVRLVVLWTMIILSPLVFILSILPQTKAQATDIWREFMSHVLAGPVMVFFLWLAFAAFGSGNAAEQLGMTTPEGGFGVSISEAASYDNLANFAVAIAFLLLGMERVQKLGLRGQAFADKAGKFVQQAAMWGTGLTYLKKEGTEAIKDWAKIGWGATGGRILDSAPIVGVGAKAKRAALIEEQDKLREMKKRKAKAKALSGLSGKVFAPSAKSMGRAAIDADLAERNRAADLEKEKGDVLLKKGKKEQQGYLEAVEEARKQIIKDNSGITKEELDKQSAKKAIEILQSGQFEMLNVVFREVDAKARSGKAESIGTYSTGLVKDAHALNQDKDAKYIRDILDKEVQEDLAEAATMDRPKLLQTMTETMKRIRTETDPGKKEKLRQKQARYNASLISRGWAEFAKDGVIDQVTGDFTDVDLNSPELAHLQDMILMGISRSDLEVAGSLDSGAAKKAQAAKYKEVFMDGTGDKSAALIRGIARATEDDAQKNGALEQAGKYILALDSAGNSHYVPANLVGAGAYGSDAVGGDLFATGDGTDGSTKGRDVRDWYVGNYGISQVGAASLVTANNERSGAATYAAGLAGGVEGMMGRLGSDSNEMAKMNTAQALRLFGSTDSAKLTNMDGNELNLSSSHVDGIDAMLKGFNAEYRAGATAQEKAITTQRLRTFLKKAKLSNELVQALVKNAQVDGFTSIDSDAALKGALTGIEAKIRSTVAKLSTERAKSGADKDEKRIEELEKLEAELTKNEAEHTDAITQVANIKKRP